MNNIELIQNMALEHFNVMELISNDLNLCKLISNSADLLANSISRGGGIFWCGNGGSAADSQHLAAELVGRFKKNRKPLKSIALSTDTSVITCIANDFSYDDIFERQLEALGGTNDVLVGISTSGNSNNVNNALSKAKELNIKSVALLGKSGGKAIDLADISIVVPSESTDRIQEAHIFIGHVFCEIIEAGLELS